MRLYRISPEEVESTLPHASRSDFDERGNPRLLGETRDGRRILVVVAHDDPGFVITVYLRN